MRRKPGALLPLELDILDAALRLRAGGQPEFHGFLVASDLKEGTGARALTAYGTLYKALERMERAGLLTSRWEDAETAFAENRPRRRLYQVTALGEEALVAGRLPSLDAAAEATA